MNSQPLLFIVTLALLLSPCHASAQSLNKYKQARISGLTVTMTLERQADVVERMDWPDEDIQLKSSSVSVKGKTIQELLLQEHIFPDVEAFSLVYALNPEIQKLKGLSVAEIQIPKLVGGDKLQKAFADNFVVLLTVEKEKKENFSRNVNQLTLLVEDLLKFGPEKFKDKSVQDSAVSSLTATVKLLSGINNKLLERYGRPLTSDVLDQLNAETQLLNSILTAKAKPEARFETPDIRTIQLVESDVKFKGSVFTEVGAAGDAPDRYPEVEVSVKTQKDGRLVPLLRIYFVPPFLRNQEGEAQPFGSLTTDKSDAPVKRRISSGTYCFWGAKDPDRSPVTNEQCQAIYSDPNVELTVIR